MKSRGIIIYKGIEKRDGGTFKNKDGNDVNYDAAYVVKFDEQNEGKYDERKLKFPVSNKALYEKFSVLKPYTEIVIVCDVSFSQNVVKLVPIDIFDVEETEE